MYTQVNKLWYMPRPSRSWGAIRWWRWYDKYLKSDVWRQKCAAVLRRANGTCECCKQQQAMEVHHLNYKRVAREHVEDLLAVCGSCHERLHARKSSQRDRFVHIRGSRSIKAPLRGGVRQTFPSIRHRSA